MNAAAKTILAIALVAIAAVVLVFGSGALAGHVAGTGAMGGGASTGAGLREYSGHLLLVLIDAGLGTVVAWMIYGNRS